MVRHGVLQQAGLSGGESGQGTRMGGEGGGWWCAGCMSRLAPGPLLQVAVPANTLVLYIAVVLHQQGTACPESSRPAPCSAITVGRVAWVCPGSIASFLPAFVGPWCAALRSVRDDVEKEHALLGLCAMLHINPAVSAGACI